MLHHASGIGCCSDFTSYPLDVAGGEPTPPTQPGSELTDLSWGRKAAAGGKTLFVYGYVRVWSYA